MNTVEVIDSDSGDLIAEVLDFDLLLSDVLVSGLGLLQEIGGRLLDGLLLRGVVDDVISDLLCLGVEGHDRLLKHLHFLLNVRFLGVHSSGFTFGALDGVLEHHELLVESFSLVFDFLLSLN